MSELAIPVLRKSLEVSQFYIPAMVDLIASHIMSKDAASAEAVLADLARVAPGHSLVTRFRDQLKSLHGESTEPDTQAKAQEPAQTTLMKDKGQSFGKKRRSKKLF